MIIDFHTHVFPDKIAEKTIAYLAEKSANRPTFNGTVRGLKENMRLSGISLSVVLPVVTAARQFESINRYAAEVNHTESVAVPRILSFAGIHPDCEDIAGKMAWIKEMGFVGVKVHPDYQARFIDDPAYVEILTHAKKHGLIFITHAGVDAGFPDMPVRCTPKRAAALLDAVPYDKVVFAHMGANRMYNEVYNALCGKNVYFDTAHVLSTIPQADFYRILEKHGADRILFATDNPWSDPVKDVQAIRALHLDKETENKIFYQNAQKLLGV